VQGKPTPEFLWGERYVIPFVKVDTGLEAEKDGVSLMRPMPELEALLTRAVRLGVFGTKMRSAVKRGCRLAPTASGGYTIGANPGEGCARFRNSLVQPPELTNPTAVRKRPA
jgi:fructose-bisphosphate aldolase class 1